MRFLLDTCTFLWIATDPVRVPERVSSQLQSNEAVLFLSSASAWEISIKFGSGKITLPEVPERCLPEIRDAYGIFLLELSEKAALKTASLPPLHRDPFDRALVAQAVVDKFTLVTPDELIRQYSVDSLW